MILFKKIKTSHREAEAGKFSEFKVSLGYMASFKPDNASEMGEGNRLPKKTMKVHTKLLHTALISLEDLPFLNLLFRFLKNISRFSNL